MKIYALSMNETDVAVYLKEENEVYDTDMLLRSDAHQIANQWVAPEVYLSWYGFYDKKKKKRLSMVDIPSSALNCLILTKNARDKLGPILEPFGEFLPLICDEVELIAFRVNHVVDALDIAKSTPLYPGDKFIPASIEEISVPCAFFIEKLQNALVFRVPGIPSLFVTDLFVEMVRSSGLTGLALRLEYDSELDMHGFDYLGNPRSAPL